MYVYIYIYIYTYICTAGQDVVRGKVLEALQFAGIQVSGRKITRSYNPTRIQPGPTVSFHNFKSQKIKLSVSNPKGKYVAYVSVLSRISNC